PCVSAKGFTVHRRPTRGRSHDSANWGPRGRDEGRAMNRRLFVLVAGMAMGAPPAPTGAADQVPLGRQPGYAGAAGFFGDRPPLPGPAGTSCNETHVIAWNGDTVVGGGSVSPAQAPWVVAIERYRIDFDGTDEPPIGYDASGGAIVDPGVVEID